jgi:hypothetical protein
MPNYYYTSKVSHKSEFRDIMRHARFTVINFKFAVKVITCGQSP